MQGVQDTAGQAAGQVQDTAGGAVDQVSEIAENVAPGTQLLGEPTTNEQGQTVQRTVDEQGNIIEETVDEEGNPRRPWKAELIVQEQEIEVEGVLTRYLTAGEGSPLVLLHGVGDNALDWRWVMLPLARDHRIYAPDLPGSGGSAKPAADRYSPAFFERFVGAFLDALGAERAAVVGNSLGGLAGLRFALSEPERVTALGLVAGAGLGRKVSPALRSLSLPGYGRMAVAWGRRRPGAAQRALGRSALLFAHPWRVPRKWLEEQYRLARLPGFLKAQLATVRAQVGIRGQREVLVEQLPDLLTPTLVLWGERDRVLPPSQAHEAITRLPNGSLELIPNCGHLPQVEHPERFASSLARFLGEKPDRWSTPLR